MRIDRIRQNRKGRDERKGEERRGEKARGEMRGKHGGRNALNALKQTAMRGSSSTKAKLPQKLTQKGQTQKGQTQKGHGLSHDMPCRAVPWYTSVLYGDNQD